MIEYLQKFRTNHTITNGLPSNDVRSIAVDSQNSIWAGTSKGLSRFDGVKWTLVAEIADISILYVDSNQELWSVAKHCLFDKNYQIVLEIPERIRTIAEDNRGQVWISGSNKIYFRMPDGTWHQFDKEFIEYNIQDMVIDNDGRIWLATDNGLICYCGGEVVLFNQKNSGLPSNNLRCIEIDQHGHLWIGSNAGVTVFDRQTEWYLINGSKSGMPYEDVTRIRLGPYGQRWIGTTLGAILWDNGKWEYFHSKRWLLDDRINAISIQDDSTTFIATSEGISQIEKRKYTLEQKAEVFQKIALARHDRRGYITSCNLKKPGDLSNCMYQASDNDGLWTSLYVATQSFRYAATGQPTAKELARKSMEAIIQLESITPIDGLLARSIIQKGEPVDKSHGEWHDTEDGLYEWKGDTSSDELDGHLFAYSVYYDLVADETEKQNIAAVVHRIMTYIVDNDFLLIDLDGQHTTWGVWSPRMLNGEWKLQRNLNSLEILSMLKTAHHITGDQKFHQAYLHLIHQHHYALNSIDQKLTAPDPTNHSDDELALVVYYPLLKYETDPDLRSIYMFGFQRSWQIISAECNPLWNFAYGALTGNHYYYQQSIDSLQRLPMDLICWTVINSHRSDIEIAAEEPGINEPQSVIPLPADERRMMKWNGNPYTLDYAGGGRTEEDPTIFLLPYWMGRYHGLV
ncbi:MAG: hypothetical protein NZ961_03435 [Candidatus Poribacteria bacterium]|nr:hypothetical protein [Candidatus Poribacteria bacterium]